MSLDRPPKTETPFRRVAILFSGGPAPAANAVIASAAGAFLHAGIEVLGVLRGYSGLVGYESGKALHEGKHYLTFNRDMVEMMRNTQGIHIGTARTNPGKDVASPEHLQDSQRTAGLRSVHAALCSLGVDALVSIGGDDTLKTANKFQRFQEFLPSDSKRIPVVHLPKTIDNDYSGIDFTFGYFTAVDVLANEIHNLLYDAMSSQSYFICETMGRNAGWLAYGAAIAGDASLVISVEDLTGPYVQEETNLEAGTGIGQKRRVMNVEAVVKRIVATMRAREEKEGKEFGVIAVAEGLGEMLPGQYIDNIERDPHGHIAITKLNLARMLSDLVAAEYQRQTGKKRKVNGLQLGYESRCARPHAFDIILGSQLGVGAYRALVEERLDGVLVSVSGQLDLTYVPFDKLVDPQTLVTVVRYVKPGSDFHKLARFLELDIEN